MPDPRQHVIAVIEDDPGALYVLRRTLERAGYRVQAFPSAGPALEHLAREPVDLVITDYWLGDMTGCDLLDELRRARGAAPPALVITGSLPALPKDAQAGVLAVLEKPCPSETLLGEVQRALRETG